jgi:glutamate synthase domain-containing protein 2
MKRYLPWLALVAAVPASALLALWVHAAWWAAFALVAPLAGLGTRDFLQRRHTLLRNYPLLAHGRWLLEGVRTEIRQYLIESDTEAAPFSRRQRSLVYSRAKGDNDKVPFGTELDVEAEAHEWLNPSAVPVRAEPDPDPRVRVGNDQCDRPYDSSVLNISAMSFGSLSAAAVRALNKGAAAGGFAHDTGEGGISAYHREHGADLVWEIGSGYYGCRDARGRFSAERFAEQAADPQVRMIELKLSQGAKPGHGGVLPAAKVTPEIAAAREVPPWRDCISPSAHPEFSTPVEMLAFLGRLRALSGGKPVGFKLCIGHRWEFLAICKAMRETEIVPDFVVVDGSEGGTGAAPLELTDHVGTPLRDGLVFVHNALVGCDLRHRVRVAAAGKVTSGFRLARNLALGADWCNAARAFMFALGCVQSQSCHTDRCPTGITTQDPWRQRGLDVADKAERVRRFHAHTVAALAEVVGACGVAHPGELRPRHFARHSGSASLATLDTFYPPLERGELLQGTTRTDYREDWRRARPDSFRPAA